MANVFFTEKENAFLQAPTLKLRQRLQSAPGVKHKLWLFFFPLWQGSVVWECSVQWSFTIFFSLSEKLLKSETAKTIKTPLPSGRRAFGTVNKISIPIPAVGTQEMKLLKPQVRHTHIKVYLQVHSCYLVVPINFFVLFQTLEAILIMLYFKCSCW